MTRYQLSLLGQSLPRQGLLRTAPNPYAVVTVTDGPQKGHKIGTTETIVKSFDPDWTAVFFVETDKSIFMPFKVEIFHDKQPTTNPDEYDSTDHRGDGDRLIGTAHFEATEVFECKGHIQFMQLEGSSRYAKVIASMEESIRDPESGNSSFASGKIDFEIRGLDIKNVEPGPLGLGRSDPFFEIAKKAVDHSAGIARWNVVYRSEHIDNHLNPYWNPFSLGMEELCYCDLDWPIKIIVNDFEESGKHREIGHLETTTKALLEHVSIRGNADRERAFEILSGDESSSADAAALTRGLIVVVKAQHFANGEGAAI